MSRSNSSSETDPTSLSQSIQKCKRSYQRIKQIVLVAYQRVSNYDVVTKDVEKGNRMFQTCHLEDLFSLKPSRERELARIKAYSIGVGVLTGQLVYFAGRRLTTGIALLLRLSSDRRSTIFFSAPSLGCIGIASTAAALGATQQTYRSAMNPHSKPSIFDRESMISQRSWYHMFEYRAPTLFDVDLSGLFRSPVTLSCVVLVTLVSHRLLGGRSRYLAPADLFEVGTFARKSVEAQGAEYATSSQKDLLQKFGRKYGCHHCGKRIHTLSAQLRRLSDSIFRRSAAHPYGTIYIGDHIPPNGIITHEQKSLTSRIKKSLNLYSRPPQRFFPECTDCSSKQSKAVATKRRTLVFPRSFKLYDLYFPVHLVLLLLLPTIIAVERATNVTLINLNK